MPWGMMDADQEAQAAATRQRTAEDTSRSSAAIQAGLSGEDAARTPYSVARSVRSGIGGFAKNLNAALQKGQDQKTLKALLPTSDRTPDFSLSPLMKPGS